MTRRTKDKNMKTLAGKLDEIGSFNHPHSIGLRKRIDKKSEQKRIKLN